MILMINTNFIMKVWSCIIKSNILHTDIRFKCISSRIKSFKSLALDGVTSADHISKNSIVNCSICMSYIAVTEKAS